MAAKKKRKKKKPAGKKSNPAFDFIIAALTRNPKAEYASIRDNAKKKRLTIHAIMYGRAKLLLGLVKAKRRKSKAKKTATKKRGPGRPKKLAARRRPGRPRKVAARRGPGRPRKVASGLDGIVAQISGLQRERDRAVKVLAKIRDLLDQV